MPERPLVTLGAMSEHSSEHEPETGDRATADHVPDWFRAALTMESDRLNVDVDGTNIVADAWGDPAHPGLVLVHGGAAHHEWWRHVAAVLSSGYRVVAPSLSGHGDSGRRTDYTPSAWASEVVAVAEAAGLYDADQLPVLIGHSMGGFVSVQAAAEHGDRFAGVAVVDSPINRPDPELEASRSGKIFLNRVAYPTYETARRRFRTVPPQDHYLPYVIDHVIAHSLREVDGGWTWKYDPEIFVPPRSTTRDALAKVEIPIALLRSEFGIATTDTWAFMCELIGRPIPSAVIPNAGHHPMLDEPLALAGTIRGLLAAWPLGPQSTPPPSNSA